MIRKKKGFVIQEALNKDVGINNYKDWKTVSTFKDKSAANSALKDLRSKNPQLNYCIRANLKG